MPTRRRRKRPRGYRASDLRRSTSQAPLVRRESANPSRAASMTAPLRRPENPDVPEHIAAAEAWQCHGHQAHIAACAVARSVIEAAAKDFNITVRGIEAKIDAFAERNLIWGDHIGSAHIVRQFGNDAAHGDVWSRSAQPRPATSSTSWTSCCISCSPRWPDLSGYATHARSAGSRADRQTPRDLLGCCRVDHPASGGRDPRLPRVADRKARRKW